MDAWKLMHKGFAPTGKVVGEWWSRRDGGDVIEDDAGDLWIVESQEDYTCESAAGGGVYKPGPDVEAAYKARTPLKEPQKAVSWYD